MSQLIQLVQESCKEASQNAMWVPIISGLSAILGASVVALANYCTSKKAAEASQSIESKKLHVTLVTNERLRWLQDLRTRLSSLYVHLDTQRDLLRRPVPEALRANRQSELDELSKKVMSEVNNITLMLNPSKPDQKNLKDALQEVLGLIPLAQDADAHAASADYYKNIKTLAFDSLTRIGIATWRQIQDLE